MENPSLDEVTRSSAQLSFARASQNLAILRRDGRSRSTALPGNAPIGEILDLPDRESGGAEAEVPERDGPDNLRDGTIRFLTEIRYLYMRERIPIRRPLRQVYNRQTQMQREMKRTIFGLLLVLCPISLAAQPQDSVRMLWIGNSFTYFNDLPGMVREIAASQGVKLSCTRFLKGGERFSGHLKNPELIRALISGHWDYIVLQEQSTAPAMSTRQVIQKVYPAAHALDSLAHVGSPEAKVVFYMTWGHKFGNRKPVANYPLANDYEHMQERLKTSYLEMAYDNDAWCAPVGMAWQQVRRERPECELYRSDNYHPAVPGSYLAANVIFTTLFRKPYRTEFTADLPTSLAEYLQQIAQQTVLDNFVLLNIR